MENSQAPEFLASSDVLKAHVETLLSFLSTARPTAVNLGTAMRRLTRILHSSFSTGKNARDIAGLLIAEGKLIADEDIDRNKEMSKLGADWLMQHQQGGDNDKLGLNILTVCNTGSLATSVSCPNIFMVMIVPNLRRDTAQLWA